MIAGRHGALALLMVAQSWGLVPAMALGILAFALAAAVWRGLPETLSRARTA